MNTLSLYCIFCTTQYPGLVGMSGSFLVLAGICSSGVVLGLVFTPPTSAQPDNQVVRETILRMSIWLYNPQKQPFDYLSLIFAQPVETGGGDTREKVVESALQLVPLVPAKVRHSPPTQDALRCRSLQYLRLDLGNHEAFVLPMNSLLTKDHARTLNIDREVIGWILSAMGLASVVGKVLRYIRMS